MKKMFTTLLLALLGSATAFSQDKNDADFARKTLEINRKGLTVLGGWGVANIIYSGVSVGNSVGETRPFHQMNIGWGAINTALAGVGILVAKRKELPKNGLETLELQHSTEKTFLVNTALDVAYVAGGYAMTQYGKNQADIAKNNRFNGFGKSVMLQGGFLFLFDAVMYGIHRKHYKDNRMQFISNGNSAGLRYSLD